jgi:hypothetical protein
MNVKNMDRKTVLSELSKLVDKHKVIKGTYIKTLGQDDIFEVPVNRTTELKTISMNNKDIYVPITKDRDVPAGSLSEKQLQYLLSTVKNPDSLAILEKYMQQMEEEPEPPSLFDMMEKKKQKDEEEKKTKDKLMGLEIKTEKEIEVPFSQQLETNKKTLKAQTAIYLNQLKSGSLKNVVDYNDWIRDNNINNFMKELEDLGLASEKDRLKNSIENVGKFVLTKSSKAKAIGRRV